VPDPEDEAIRDLTRARNDVRQAERKAKQRLNSFLLRNNLIYPRKTKWNRAYFYWLGFVVMKHLAQKIAFQSLGGVSLIAATIAVAELGNISRFQHPKELMAYLGLVPSEHSSGESVRRCYITKTGNSHARRVLVESAWTYKHHARVTLPLKNDRRGYPEVSARFSGRRNYAYVPVTEGLWQEKNRCKLL